MKILVLLAVLLGFGASFISFKMSTGEVYSNTPGWLCPGENYNNGPGILEAGFPLRAKVSVDIYGTCGKISKADTLSKGFKVFNIFLVWQFYVNWVSWSLPIVGVGYALIRRHANSKK